MEQWSIVDVELFLPKEYLALASTASSSLLKLKGRTGQIFLVSIMALKRKKNARTTGKDPKLKEYMNPDMNAVLNPLE